MPDEWLEFDALEIAGGMNVDEDEVIDMMNDGRCASHWMEHRIRSAFGLDKPDGYGDAMSDNGPVEIKGITKSGVGIVPSSMLGVQRSVDWDRLDEWFDKMSGGFILHDNTQFPCVPCWWIDSDTVKQWVSEGYFNNSGRMNYNTISSLLD